MIVDMTWNFLLNRQMMICLVECLRELGKLLNMEPTIGYNDGVKMNTKYQLLFYFYLINNISLINILFELLLFYL